MLFFATAIPEIIPPHLLPTAQGTLISTTDALREYHDASVALTAEVGRDDNSEKGKDRFYAAELRCDRAAVALFTVCEQVGQGTRKVSRDAVKLALELATYRDARGREVGAPDMQEVADMLAQHRALAA